jgi:hypothetical protein
VVVGVGIGQVVGGGDEAGDASHPESADRALDSGGEASSDGGARAPEGAPQQLSTSVRIRPGRFADDVSLLRQQAVAAYDADGEAAPGRDAELRTTGKAGCQPGSWGRGRYQPVQYGRTAGYVVLRRPQGDSQVVDLFLCGSDLVVRSVTLPSP